MGDVFANGLEVSGKAVKAQTIAAFPDVCFTPPQTPATPPGVPIPYPSFGMASDTEKGTATVLVKGKTVNIKNKSDEKRTSGTEAGCAPKKGIITSKNTGKKYFHKWSNDVKFEGEPVIRFTDLASHNHASPAGNTPPWVEICKFSPNAVDCEALFISLDIKVGRYGDSKYECPEGHQKEHTFAQRYGATFGDKYDFKKAPCICMDTRSGGATDAFRFSSTSHGLVQDRKGASASWVCKGSPHNNKTHLTYFKVADKRLAEGRNLNFGEVMDISAENTVAEHKKIKNESDQKKKDALECLTALNTWFFCCEVCGDEDGCISEDEMRKKEITTYSDKVDRMVATGKPLSRPAGY